MYIFIGGVDVHIHIYIYEWIRFKASCLLPVVSLVTPTRFQCLSIVFRGGRTGSSGAVRCRACFCIAARGVCRRLTAGDLRWAALGEAGVKKRSLIIIVLTILIMITSSWYHPLLIIHLDLLFVLLLFVFFDRFTTTPIL